MIDREAEQNEAMAAIEPLLRPIYEVVDEAVGVYFGPDYSDLARADHDDRAMASCIYSHAEKRMRALSFEVDGLSLLNVRGLKVLNFRDRALLRFKKVCPSGRHSNYQTEQQQDYDSQEEFPDLPSPAFRLTAGYHLDAAGTCLERVLIARPLGRSVFWTAQVSMWDGEVEWEDCSPIRFPGFDVGTTDASRLRGRRRA